VGNDLPNERSNMSDNVTEYLTVIIVDTIDEFETLEEAERAAEELADSIIKTQLCTARVDSVRVA
jgi:anion-transporting  ArsA/GET3 family ATPase